MASEPSTLELGKSLKLNPEPWSPPLVSSLQLLALRSGSQHHQLDSRPAHQLPFFHLRLRTSSSPSPLLPGSSSTSLLNFFGGGGRPRPHPFHEHHRRHQQWQQTLQHPPPILLVSFHHPPACIISTSCHGCDLDGDCAFAPKG